MTTANATGPKSKDTNRKTAAALPPKALAWTQHFEGRDFGARLDLLSSFAKSACIKPEMLKVADHDKAMAILSRLSLTMSMEDLKSHGSLETGLEREKRYEGYRPSARERSDWLETVSLIISAGGPMLGNMLAAYGEHIEGVAAKVEHPMRRCQFKNLTTPYSVAAKYIYKANLLRSKDYSWETGYRLVNALNGCWLAHCCGIDPGHSVIYLMEAALDEIAAKDEKMPEALASIGRYLVKPASSLVSFLEAKDDDEAGLCVSINNATIELLENAAEKIYIWNLPISS